MDENEWLAERFERERPRLRAVAYRMLGSVTEADDAVQDAWVRLSRTGSSGIDNLGGWLTTVVARECLHQLRSRRRRREVPFDAHLPELIVSDADLDPEQEVLLAEALGVALLVVLERLAPAERVAFVLHDMFDLPFADIADVVGRTPAAARQLASRARRRVNGAEVPRPDSDLARQRKVVDAFYAAARQADFDGLLQVLDPDITLRTEHGADRPASVVRGAAAVADQVRVPGGGRLRPILVNGAIGALITRDEQPYSVLVFTVADDRIARIDVLRDTDRVHQVAAAVVGQPN
ncbi:sigma-70 family RNA polymerase sigma factor [Actinokineospora globicatena]|uniref:sigma-70 family RNA polymerase sigma factor n=1 Tax=Actinokineospora globicatena TaxID=103729 RepID=UPI0020A57D02|nr:sigma-70 family RNA polymerase sigma factor [Actinokineospora globicatena]MCP2303341.1 RNA polymerase sigma-70 factor, ECF subfamily [Actinokineospora globicatena]GLW79526.1 DNA-directed RNA polymerase sigma-70 factor [Actinokineospora globicatena]GLW86064.1 DNA-directed RNA polymerase sigma-70 factor [Actinokineospora globicatena]